MLSSYINCPLRSTLRLAEFYLQIRECADHNRLWKVWCQRGQRIGRQSLSVKRGAEEGGTLRCGAAERSLLKSRIASAVDRLSLCSTSYSEKTRPKELYSLSILSLLLHYELTIIHFEYLTHITYLVPFYGNRYGRSQTPPL